MLRFSVQALRVPEYRTIACATYWNLTGAHIFEERLLRALTSMGMDARLLLTETDTDLVQLPGDLIPLPEDITAERLPVSRRASWADHWVSLVRLLASRAPCIFLPNIAYRHSCVSPKLPPNVCVVGVLHGDDPLHYEHARRLGRFWDAIVCVNQTIASNVVALDPSLSPRLHVIPNAVETPEQIPIRPRGSSKLRIIYHGVLNNQPKRILDIAAILDECERSGIPVSMTIAGDGPQKSELLHACERHIQSGSFHYVGVLSHDRVEEVLRDHDVYLLPSASEGTPYALLEAMAQGCVPLVTDIEAIAELIRDGINGYRVPVGDIGAFVGRLRTLEADPDLRIGLGSEAYRTLLGSHYQIRTMVQSYIRVFDGAIEAARNGAYRRPKGRITPPPSQVAGISIFPMEAWRQAVRSAERTLAGKPPRARHTRETLLAPFPKRMNMNFQVIAATSYWAMNGVNIFSANLVRGLIASGVPARLLLTEQNSTMVTVHEPMMPLPTDIPVETLPQLGTEETWGGHWGAMIRHLEENAPCVYLPNHDWRHSNVCSQLSPEVRVVGVVHSDDPLHYDHVARLGRYWDAIVTTTDAIAERVISQNPRLVERVRTIPIGVPVPETPRRREHAVNPLRLVYHGGLTQRQKRVFDLPNIVDEAHRLGIPVELSLIGDGAEREGLMAASAHLVDAGAIRFLGLIPHSRLMELLDQFDVFLLTSEFEGMPNALGEAMARGCIPIVTDIRSGVRELVRNGVNGFIVSVGDIPAFVDRLSILYRDPQLRLTMSAKAREAVIAGGFSVETMVERYNNLFRSLFAPEAASGFHRPQASLRLPPYQVKRVKIFQVRHAYWFDNVGAMPSMRDYKGYITELNGARRLAGRRPRPYPNVIVSATSGRVSGVDIFSANLVRGLRALGREAHVVLTCPRDSIPDPLSLPRDIPVKKLPVSRRMAWPKRWERLRAYLENNAPCIYIPNYDWRHSCISPTLSQNIGIVGIVHSDDPVHYEHVTRLGRYWNAIVAVSGAIAQRVVDLDPSLAARVVTIPYGVEVPTRLPERTPAPNGALRIVYAGRLVQAQKRVLDIPKIFGLLVSHGVPVELTIIGAGQEQDALKSACEPWIRTGQVHFLGSLPNQDVLGVFAKSDVLLLTSEFEGLPVSLLEAMAQGCVPVVTDIPSGIPEVVRQNETGYRIPVGDIRGFAECLARLHAAPSLRQALSAATYKTIRDGYSTEDMVEAYMSLFDRVLVEAELREFQRPVGQILPPPDRPFLTNRSQRWPGGEYLRHALSSVSHRLGRKS